MTTADQLNEQKVEAIEAILALQRQVAYWNTKHDEIQSQYQGLEDEWIRADGQIQDIRRQLVDEQNNAAMALEEKGRIEKEREDIALSLQNETVQGGDIPGAANESELKRWLDALLPNISLTPSSFSQLHKEIRDPSGAFKILSLLNSNPTSVSGDNLEGEDRRGWVEKHFNTGESDLGRLYFFSTGNNKSRVHIGHKKTQMHDYGQLKAVKHELKAQRSN